MAPTNENVAAITASRRVTAPSPPMPTALQAYSQSIEAIELAAEAELPPRHFATLMSVRRRRCEQKERLAERRLSRFGSVAKRAA